MDSIEHFDARGKGALSRRRTCNDSFLLSTLTSRPSLFLSLFPFPFDTATTAAAQTLASAPQ